MKAVSLCAVVSWNENKLNILKFEVSVRKEGGTSPKSVHKNNNSLGVAESEYTNYSYSGGGGYRHSSVISLIALFN